MLDLYLSRPSFLYKPIPTMLFKTLLLVVLFFIASLVSRAGGTPVRYLGIEQGLSNNAVVVLYQDHQGFMWIGTYDGLNRYDGYNFRIFRNIIGDSTSLSTNNVYNIEGDAQHNIWIGGQNGLNIYNPLTGKFTTGWYIDKAKRRPIKIQQEITSIRSINNTSVLACSYFSGLLLFENSNRTASQVPLVTAAGTIYNYQARKIEYDQPHNNIWVFVQGHGLCKYDTLKNNFTPLMPMSNRLFASWPINKAISGLAMPMASSSSMPLHIPFPIIGCRKTAMWSTSTSIQRTSYGLVPMEQGFTG
ncbi:ligand-binding sensor domain-containing protein [Paraflavitalea speifideaquila]|uniref:ligand-binding sensor domain-containing protein n=1 Tax=Paraflavitalea speifideaquila TaxID=3076558 RepID=UPI0028EFFDD4|nr:two-component regulator propeller domain-containing protein [Paraflavitalea speifideiaquila]